MSTQAAVQEKEHMKTEGKDKLQTIIQSIETLTVLELAQLVKALEEKFGVSAQAAVTMPVGGGAGAAAGGAAPAEEKTSFQVILVNAGDKKIQVIKEIRAITNLGLKEAKDLVEGAPKVIKDNASKEEAEKIKATVEAAGAKVEIK